MAADSGAWSELYAHAVGVLQPDGSLIHSEASGSRTDSSLASSSSPVGTLSVRAISPYEAQYAPLTRHVGGGSRTAKIGDRKNKIRRKVGESQLELSEYTTIPNMSLATDPSLAFVDALEDEAAARPAAWMHTTTAVHGSTRSEEGKSHSGGLLGLLTSHWPLTALLLVVPIGMTSHFLHWGPGFTFWLNFVAVVPLAWLMGAATEDLAAHTGQIAGGLLNAWFGNVVEMLLVIAGIRQGELVVVRSTLVGSILSNLLLVTGCAFLFGGFRFKVQEFSAIGASTNASLMTLSVMCLGLPTMYQTILSTNSDSATLAMSRCVSFFLIIIYLQYMVFQLGTHSFLFADEEEEEAEMHPLTAAALLAGCTVICAFSSEFLIGSISGVVNSWNISKEFIGIILLPIIGNAAEHYTSVMVAMRNKMDLSISCAVGSSCQMALFVTPFAVITSWILGQPMSLDLHAFEILVLLLAVLIMTSILQDGYSNWLEGSMLCSAYLVIAIIYFFEDPKFSEII